MQVWGIAKRKRGFVMEKNKTDVKLTGVDKIYKDVPIGAPCEEMTRRKIVIDVNHVLGHLINLSDVSLKEILADASNYPDITDVFTEGKTKHIQIDAHLVALVIEMYNRSLKNYQLKEKMNEVSKM